jgi:hypothetical protein
LTINPREQYYYFVEFEGKVKGLKDKVKGYCSRKGKKKQKKVEKGKK